jgi:NDP-sugar pyrophosphorylase family protein
MLVVLTCFTSCDPFGLLTKRIPVAMLPVLGKTIIEYHLEQISNSGLTEVCVALVENPKYMRKFLGNGERWGLNISTVDYKEPCEPELLLTKIRVSKQKRAIIIPSEIVIEPDYKVLRERAAHVMDTSLCISAPYVHYAKNELALESVHVETNYSDTGIRVISLPYNHDGSSEIRHECKWMKISSPIELAEANRLAVSGYFPWLLKRFSNDPTGNIFGHHSNRAQDSKIEGPVFIGSFAKIGKGVHIKNLSVIGNGAVISDDVTIDGSLIFDNTFIGSHTDVINKIVSGRTLFNPLTGLGIEITDPVIITGIHERHLRPKLKRMFEYVLCLCLLVITLPVWLGKVMVRLILGYSAFDKVFHVPSNEFGREDEVADSHRIPLLTFINASPFNSRLPGLFDVMKGKLSLVGVRPLTPELMEHFWEDWEMLRFEAPTGLFTIIDSDGARSLDEDEKIVMENYYAATRSFNVDLKILFKALRNLIGSKNRADLS